MGQSGRARTAQSSSRTLAEMEPEWTRAEVPWLWASSNRPPSLLESRGPGCWALALSFLDWALECQQDVVRPMAASSHVPP